MLQIKVSLSASIRSNLPIIVKSTLSRNCCETSRCSFSCNQPVDYDFYDDETCVDHVIQFEFVFYTFEMECFLLICLHVKDVPPGSYNVVSCFSFPFFKLKGIVQYLLKIY